MLIEFEPQDFEGLNNRIINDQHCCVGKIRTELITPWGVHLIIHSTFIELSIYT